MVTQVKAPQRAAGVGRLGTAAAWISAVACLPYLFLKVVWTLDMPVGLTDRSQLHSNGWVAGNAVMAAVQLAAVVLVLALVRPWARRVPAWLLLFPVWVGTGLLFQVVVGAALVGLSASEDSSVGTGGIQPWVYVMVYAAFAVQGAALAIAFACHVRARWGRVLGERTADVLSSRSAQVRRWPERHLAEIAEVVAAMAIVVAVVCAYWAVGGSIGLSDARPRDSLGLQASRVAGAVIAVVGLLGLAGRWGRRTRFWAPAALAWVGSGALVAFDALTLVTNRLFSAFGTVLPEADWAPIDTVLVIKAVIGVSAAIVGVLVTTAAKDDHQPAGAPRSSTPTTHGADRQVR
jgi:hypothetical protein